MEFQCGVETRHCSGEEDGPPSPAAANEVKLLVVECSTAACLPACLLVRRKTGRPSQVQGESGEKLALSSQACL